MRSRLIVNPVSGSNTGPDKLPGLNQRLRQEFGEMDIVITVGPGDAAAAAAAAARDGYERLFIAGGDGTLNEVVNGVAAVEGALGRIAFGIIPVGTGNDFVAALGIPEDLDAAVAVLQQGRTIQVDLGRLDDRVFVNVSAGGFIAEVSEATVPGLKTVAGKLAYLLAGAQVVLEYEPVRARIRATTPQSQVDQQLDLYMFAICNSRQIGGGRLIAPDAIIDDGLLDVCLVQAMPTLDFIGLLTRVAAGDHVSDPRVSYFRATSIELGFERAIHVNTDGEVLHARTCRYSIQPRLARFFAAAAPYAAGDSA